MDTPRDAADAGAGVEWAPPTGAPIAPGVAGEPSAVAVAGGAAPGWASSPAASSGTVPGWQAPPPRVGAPGVAVRNEAARWARICAIVSVLFNPLLLVSITAIVLGIVGLHRSDQPPFAGRWDSGRRQAITGIGIGVLGLVISTVFVVLFTLSLVPRVR